MSDTTTPRKHVYVPHADVSPKRSLDEPIQYDRLEKLAATRRQLTELDRLRHNFERRDITTYRKALEYAKAHIDKGEVSTTSHGVRDPYMFPYTGSLPLKLWYRHLHERGHPLFRKGFKPKELE